jgi:hypothetical protein
MRRPDETKTSKTIALFAVYIGRAEIVPVYYPLLMKSVQIAFLVFGFMCVAGVYA